MARRSDHHSLTEADMVPSLNDMTDQHETASRLLGPQANDEPSSPEDDVATNHSRNSLPATPQGDMASSDEHHGSPKAFLWKGLPLSSLVWELLNVLLAVCFLGRPYFFLYKVDADTRTVLGTFIASLAGKPESEWTIRVVQASKIAPSIWPVVFSGILGNAVRALADWRVERGASLLGLEQLLGSLTVRNCFPSPLVLLQFTDSLSDGEFYHHHISLVNF